MAWRTARTLAFAILASACAIAQAPPSDLKLVITIEQTRLPRPLPAHITLHLHNAGSETLWLYHRARPARREPVSESGPASPDQLVIPTKPVEGPTLAARLATEDGKLFGASDAFESVGLAHPRLVRLAPGEDYDEKTALRLTPAVRAGAGSPAPVWGKYRLSLQYAAGYTNAEEVERIADVKLWQGQVPSNEIEVELAPPEGSGTITGSVEGPDSRPLSAVVTLTDDQDRLIGQARPDFDGKFSFERLPLGLYWVTARRPDAAAETAVFRHVVVNSENPEAKVDFLLTPQEQYEPKYFAHKPVLVRVVDREGRPLEKVSLQITWSSGTVMDNVKGVTEADGLAAVSVMPGRNYVTLSHKGCKKDDSRIDVSEEGVIDGFSLEYDCARK